jgi:hypothetical protein
MLAMGNVVGSQVKPYGSLSSSSAKCKMHTRHHSVEFFLREFLI